MIKSNEIETALKYDHLFFDLDHTLWDFDSNAKDCLEVLYHEFDLKSRAIDFEAFYQTYLGHNAILWTRFEKGYMSADELKWKRMWRTLLDFKIADERLSKDISAYYLEILPTRKKVFEYTFEILDYLTEKGYQLHLLTNGFEKTQRGKLASSNLTGYFKTIVTSEISNSMKPKKEIFEFALRQVKGSLKNSIMIGDNVDADIAGAVNAGMDCIFVNHLKKELNPNCTYTIHHLKDLEEIL